MNQPLNSEAFLTTKKLPIFTDSDLHRTKEYLSLESSDIILENLQKQRFKNFIKLKKEYKINALSRAMYEKEICEPSKEVNIWHLDHPETPVWAHAQSIKVMALYRQLRGFTLAAESKKSSHETEEAKDKLHHSLLNGTDKKKLIEYFHHHDFHDCRDNSANNQAYWATQNELQTIVTKIPPMNRSVTVWRGEKYSLLDCGFDGKNERTIERIVYLQGLKPGDSFSWDNCVATSLNLSTAASGNFSGPMRPEKIRVMDSKDTSQAAFHSVLFELETDRGVYIDRQLVASAPSNEDEILLPRHMKFTVVGHALVNGKIIDSVNSSNLAFHVIKLKLVRK